MDKFLLELMTIVNSNRIIVTLWSTVLCLTCGACSSAPSTLTAIKPVPAAPNQQSQTAPEQETVYGVPVQLGVLEDRNITESSGLAASAMNKNVFWTHNDSGDAALLYAFDRGGKSRGVWRVPGAAAKDWEDLAIGPGRRAGTFDFYIGDIGDSIASPRRTEITIYRVAEPSVPIGAGVTLSSKARPNLTEPAQALRFKYPDGAHDAEALLVHPLTGTLYIVTKTFGVQSGIYKATPPFNLTSVATLTRVGEVRLPSTIGNLITGGAISPDGTRVVLCDYLRAYEMRLPNRNRRAAASKESTHNSFDEVWRQPMTQIELGLRTQGEAICYRADGAALLTTSEGQPATFSEVTVKLK